MPDSLPDHSSNWTVDQIRPGDPYEISEGRRIAVAPPPKVCVDARIWGSTVIWTNPNVKRAGIDVGLSTRPDMLRGVDVGVIVEDGDNDWMHIAPPLAVEYVGHGRDLAELNRKIDELMAAGTRYLWIVRLDGPPRVEVYGPGHAMFTRVAGEHLDAGDVLDEPLPVEALHDEDAAAPVILRNLLRRRGYRDLEAVRHEGFDQQRSLSQSLPVRPDMQGEP